MTERAIAPVPPVAYRSKPGQSGNPSGLPKNFRRVTDALRQLTETKGRSPEAVIEAFKAARGKKLCGADFKAIAMFQAESDADRRSHVAAFEAVTDRLEGKVPQAVNVRSESITINVVDRDVQLALLRAARRRPLLEAEAIEEETPEGPTGDAAPNEETGE